MSKVKEKKVPLVLIEWGDAHANSKWVTSEAADQLHEPIKVRNIGFIIRDDAVGVMLTSGFDENNNLVGNFFIPRSCINKITKVKY